MRGQATITSCAIGKEKKRPLIGFRALLTFPRSLSLFPMSVPSTIMHCYFSKHADCLKAATRFCRSCGNRSFCQTCDTRAHIPTVRKSHERTAFCVFCDSPSTLYCLDCPSTFPHRGLHLCDGCIGAEHFHPDQDAHQFRLLDGKVITFGQDAVGQAVQRQQEEDRHKKDRDGHQRRDKGDNAQKDADLQSRKDKEQRPRKEKQGQNGAENEEQGQVWSLVTESCH